MNQQETPLVEFEGWLFIQDLTERTIREYMYWYRKLLADLMAYDTKLNQESMERFLMKNKNGVVKAMLRQVLSYGKSRGYEFADNIEIPRGKRKPRGLSPEFLEPHEIKALMDYFKHVGHSDMYLFVAIAFQTGLRVSEVCNIRKQDIDFEKYVVTGKGKGSMGGKPFKKPLRPDLCHLIHKNSTQLKPELRVVDLKPKSVWRLLRNAGRAVLGKKIWPHMIRHSTATFLLKQGFSLLEIKEFLRHECVSSTQVYTHIKEKELEAKVVSVLETTPEL